MSNVVKRFLLDWSIRYVRHSHPGCVGDRSRYRSNRGITQSSGGLRKRAGTADRQTFPPGKACRTNQEALPIFLLNSGASSTLTARAPSIRLFSLSLFSPSVRSAGTPIFGALKMVALPTAFGSPYHSRPNGSASLIRSTPGRSLRGLCVDGFRIGAWLRSTSRSYATTFALEGRSFVGRVEIAHAQSKPFLSCDKISKRRQRLVTVLGSSIS